MADFRNLPASMKSYDVIIVGAGPAGLRCAEILAGSSLSVLLLEKEEQPVYKVCAGGITRKDIAILNLPAHLIERSITSTEITSRLNRSATEAASPFIFTVNRKEFSEYQHSLLNTGKVEVQFHSRVTKVTKEYVVVNGPGTNCLPVPGRCRRVQLCSEEVPWIPD